MSERCLLGGLTRNERLKGGRKITVRGQQFKVMCGGGGQQSLNESCAYEQFRENFDPKYDALYSKYTVPCSRSGGQFRATKISE